MERGPLKTPPALQLVRGDPRQRGKRALAAMLDEQVRPPVAIPEPPDFLRYRGSGPSIAIEARAEWDRLAPHLARLGLVTELDRAALAGYCFAWSLSVHAKRKIIELQDAALVDTTPSGYKQLGVWLQVAGRADAELKAYIAHFGLSPASRSRVTAGDPQASLPGLEKPQEGGWAAFPA